MKREISQLATLFTAKAANYTSDQIDISGYKNFAIQVNYSSTGTIKIQGSINATNWVDLELSPGSTEITASDGSELINFVEVGFPYIRIVLGGSITAASALFCIKR